MDRIGPYELLDEIGAGGFGRVYRARHVELGIVRAIKIVEAPGVVDQLRREAAALAHLQGCPRIVRVEDIETGGGKACVRMEYMEGGDLRTRLAKGSLPVAEALRITLDVLEALEYAHQRDVVHGDVKPSNILLDREDRAKLSDFGVWVPRSAGSGFVTDSESRPRQEAAREHSGFGVATQRYMSPEQLDPSLLKGEELDGRSDLYSLGLVLYEMLTGQCPMFAWAPPSQVNQCSPRSLDEVVRKLLSHARVGRYENAKSTADALDRVSREQVPGAPDPATEERSLPVVGPGAGRRLWRRVAGTAAIVALAAFGGVMVTRQGDLPGTSSELSEEAPLPPAGDETESEPSSASGGDSSERGGGISVPSATERATKAPEGATEEGSTPDEPEDADSAAEATSEGSVGERAETQGRGGSDGRPVSIIMSDQVSRVSGGWTYLDATTSIGSLIYDGYGHLGSFDSCVFDVRGWEWFTAFVGVRDSHFGDDAGIATVAVDGEIVRQISRRRGDRATRAVIDLRGRQTLTLSREGNIVFAEPRLVKGDRPSLDAPSASSQRVPNLHAGERVIDEESPRTAGVWNHLESTVSIGGVLYDDFGHLGSFERCTFDARGWDWLSAHVGVPEDHFGNTGRLTVLVDGRQVWQQSKRKGERAAHLVVDLRGHQTVTLARSGRIVLARPRFVKGPRPD